MATRNYSVDLQIALNLNVEIQAESFEDALVQGREMVSGARAATHMVRRSLAKSDTAVTINDTEANLCGVRDDDAGMMYR